MRKDLAERLSKELKELSNELPKNKDGKYAGYINTILGSNLKEILDLLKEEIQLEYLDKKSLNKQVDELLQILPRAKSGKINGYITLATGEKIKTLIDDLISKEISPTMDSQGKNTVPQACASQPEESEVIIQKFSSMHVALESSEVDANTKLGLFTSQRLEEKKIIKKDEDQSTDINISSITSAFAACKVSNTKFTDLDGELRDKFFNEINDGFKEAFKNILGIQSLAEKNALTEWQSQWQSQVIMAIQFFLRQVKQEVINKHSLTLDSLIISYVPEPSEEYNRVLMLPEASELDNDEYENTIVLVQSKNSEKSQSRLVAYWKNNREIWVSHEIEKQHENFLQEIFRSKNEILRAEKQFLEVASKCGYIQIKNAAQILKQCLSEVGLTVTLAPLTTADALEAQQAAGHDLLIVLCTPAYAIKAKQESRIREVIGGYGESKKRSDSLHTLLCVGGFNDTALKVVDGHYFIREYQGALKLEASLTALQTFVDVILNISGSRGLGLLPDLLDLEKMERAKARSAYLTLFDDLSKTLQDLTSRYRLSQDVERKIEQNALKAYAGPNVHVNSLAAALLAKPAAKTGLFLCSTKGDTLLTGLHLEQQLLSEGKLLLSIDCQDYAPQKLAGQSVRLALQHLGFKRPDIEALKHQPLVILFKNYEQLGAYDNLYVKNQLQQWSKVKVLVTCRTDFFQHRGYQSCFLSDPANPQMDSLIVHQIPHFAPQEAEVQALSPLQQSQNLNIIAQEEILHPKKQAIQLEVSLFLQRLNQTLVEKGKIKPILSEKSQVFISYAWEVDETALARLQRKLSRIARDLSTLGIPTWLDIERMTGDMNEQMAGNIEGSRYVLVIGTPRYTQRAAQTTNVKKEYEKILKKLNEDSLKVFLLKFADETPFPKELSEHKNAQHLDFRQMDDETAYFEQLIQLIPHLVDTTSVHYSAHVDAFNRALELLPAKYLITDKNQDEIQSYDIDNRLKAYVEPNALSRPDDSLDSRYDLPKHFNEFLSKKTKTYVTFGRAGSGKSLFTLFTFKNLLQAWHQWRSSDISKKPALPEWLPIYIPLKNYANEKANQAIELALRDVYQLDDEDIQNLKQGLGVEQKILFILDGYDELGKGVRPNYAEQLKDWSHAKLLISSRPEHFDKDSQHLEAFSLDQNYNSFKAIYVSPFSPEEIKEYIAAYDGKPDTYAKIESIPGLLPLLDNPFLLNIVLQALPRLTETHKDSKHAIKRSDIYSAFIDTLFNKEAYKQEEIQGKKIELSRYHQFAEELAFSLCTEKTISITPDNPTIWKKFTEEEAHIREACPLKRTGEAYMFLHKSVYEYFVAAHLWNALKENAAVLASRWKTRPLTEERAVIDFLVEFYQTNRSFQFSSKEEKAIYLQAKEQLFALIESSKQQAEVAQAAANAITVLNSANVVFWNKDFSNVCIPGADLRNAICDNSNFSNADLTNVQLQAASLSNANFQNAKMQGVTFGELPSLPLKDESHSCCYSKDGRLLAVATGNNIQIYNTYTRALLHTLEGHSRSVNSIAFSPSGEQLASGSDDHSIRLWNVERGELRKILKGHRNSVRSVTFSLNGEKLASGSRDKTIRLWNVKNGELQKILKIDSDIIFSVAFSPNGEQLASGIDNTIQLWNVECGELQKTLEGHSDIVWSVAFSPNGEQLASGSKDYSIRLWNVENGELQKILEGHRNIVRSVTFSPNGEQLASGGDNIRLWHVKHGELQKTLEGHNNCVTSVSFSPNGEQLASVSEDKTIRLWHIERGELQKTLEGHTDWVNSISFSPNGEQLASGSYDHTIRLWSVERGELQKILEGHTEGVQSVSFSPKGDQLASGSHDHTIRLWNVETGILQKILKGHIGSVNSVAYNPNGEQLASCGGYRDYSIRLWNVENGELQKILEGHICAVTSVVYSPNGEQLASGGAYGDNSTRLWNVERGELQKILKGRHHDSVTSLAFSPSGEQLASASNDKTIRLWNIEHGKLPKIIGGHTKGVTSVSFSSNGELLASGSDDQTIRLWNGAVQLTSLNMFSSIKSIAWRKHSQNGEAYLATGHRDASVRYWRVTQLQNTPCFELLWSSKKSTQLRLEGANVEEVKGLSKNDADLLEQRGAKGKPDMQSQPQQEKLQEAANSSIALPTASVTTGLSSFGFFAQRRETEVKIKTENELEHEELMQLQQ